MKKTLPILMSLFFLATCQTLPISKKPEARFKKVDIKTISLQDVTLKFDIEIYNPYPIGLKLKDVDLTFFIEGKRLLRTKTGKGLKIKARGTQASSIDVILKYSDIAKIVRDYTQKDYLNLQIDAVVAIPLPKLPKVPPKQNSTTNLKHKYPPLNRK